MWHDIRLAIRSLTQNWRWTLIAAVSLAFGIGLNAGALRIVLPIIVPLPVRNPEELVAFRQGERTDVRNIPQFSSYIFEQFKAANHTLSDIIAFSVANNCLVSECPGNGNLVVDGQGGSVSVQYVSGNFFTALGISAWRGRTIEVGDDSLSAPPVAVISNQLWRRRFQSNPALLGTVAIFDNRPVTIVGVLPEGVKDLFRPDMEVAEVSVPIALDARRGNRYVPKEGLARFWEKMPSYWLGIMGRRKPGITVAQVQANFRDLSRSAALEEWNNFLATLTPAERRDPIISVKRSWSQATVVPSSRGVLDLDPSFVKQLVFLVVITSVTLIIVGMNVTNLLLARAAVRQHEVAIRWAIGGSRGRLIRETLIETVLLSNFAGLLSLGVAQWPALLLAILPPGVPTPLLPPVVDVRVLAFTLMLSLLTGVVFGLGPALRTVSLDRAAGMRGPVVPFGGQRSVMARVLMITQVALSITLLIVAGLFTRSIQSTRNTSLGFNPANVAVFDLNPAAAGIRETRIAEVQNQVLEKVLRMPGVRSASFSDSLLIAEGRFESPARVLMERLDDKTRLPSTERRTIHPDFFTTLEIPLRSGRFFNSNDTANASPVVIVNEAFVKAFFQTPFPIGASVFYETPGRQRAEAVVVGVVGDTQIGGSLQKTPQPILYTSYLQQSPGAKMFIVRTSGDAAGFLPAIRAAIRAVDPSLPVFSLFTHSFLTDVRLMGDAFVIAPATRIVAMLALIFSMIGLFSLMSYTVARRTKEIGIRMAVGARPIDVLMAVIKETQLLVLIGVLVGVPLAMAVTIVLESQLTGVNPGDPVTVSLVVALTFGVAAIAGYLPARRAAQVDPMIALRHE